MVKLTHKKSKAKKSIRVWSPRDSGIEFEYLEHAVKEATEIALRDKCKAEVFIETTEEDGTISQSIRVAVIRGSKFNNFGQIKKKEGGK